MRVYDEKTEQYGTILKQQNGTVTIRWTGEDGEVYISYRADLCGLEIVK